MLEMERPTAAIFCFELRGDASIQLLVATQCLWQLGTTAAPQDTSFGSQVDLDYDVRLPRFYRAARSCRRLASTPKDDDRQEFERGG